MKRTKIITAFLTAVLMLCIPLQAIAESYEGSDQWKVTINEEGKMESNFHSGDIEQAASEMEPGDTITLMITIENKYEKSVNWYMSNEVLSSLEDSKSGATGGAYEYLLTYTDGSGRQNTLYSSDTVGGETVIADGREGLHEATSAMEDYFFLDEMASKKSGVVQLQITLDGESQGNGYQDTFANLQMNFAAEVRGEPTVVNTGVEAPNLLPFYILMAVSGLALIAFAIVLICRRKKEANK